MLLNTNQACTLEYDLGDSWEHEVKLSSIKEYASDECRQIKFIGGKCACPPEDCGGVWGYENLISLWNKSKDDSLDDYEKEELEWAGVDEEFDPEYIDTENCKEIV